METVKVDIQKLQLLNDRIAQTIDALNQVRMSAHGIHHTPALSPWAVNPYTTYGTSPFVQGSYPTPYSQFTPYSVPFAPTPYPTTLGAGIQHSSAQYVPYTVPFVPTQLATGMQPTTASYPQQQLSVPWANNGISHTSAWDPTFRTAQTYPWVQWW